jgi:hypothetical protein
MEQAEMERTEEVKRYRVTNFFFDGTRGLLRDPSKELQPQREEFKKVFEIKYGTNERDGKLARYMEFDPPNICIISEYLNLLHEISDAYVFGSFYPALTGACSLGERIFNILIINLRNDYKTHESYYKEVYSKDSFQDWGKAITILRQWKVIDDSIEKEYRALATLRNESIHFGELKNVQASALSALKTVMIITDKLFGLKSDFFFWCPGEIYVKKTRENEPFIKAFINSRCTLLGYKHSVGGSSTKDGVSLVFQDSQDYEEREISDEEFRNLRIEYTNRRR